ncbi:MAG: hypothetical protein WKF30_12110 [Pyrinomonadaceae bacterium]
MRSTHLIKLFLLLLVLGLPARGAELSVADFDFNGALGSAGARLEKIERNHFKVTLGAAPQHADWSNKLQFKIKRHAKGNALRLDVVFHGGDAYLFNEYFHSWSYDARNWRPVYWQLRSTSSQPGDTLVFPAFTQDVVYVAHQVPMSYEEMVQLIARWRKSPFVRVHEIGRSLGGKAIYRLIITDARRKGAARFASPRWSHYFTNQHPGEHNAQWRMVGMIDWLLSDEGRNYRRAGICHFVLMMSPDSPAQGWYRVGAQGVDMNRSYRAAGSDRSAQAHEAYLCQKDLEQLMASEAPLTTVWSMHTWPGIVEPIGVPGPEVGVRVGQLAELREAIRRHDHRQLIKPLALRKESPAGDTTWSDGPHAQFGITAFLCEGGGDIYTKDDNLYTGTVLMKSIADYYRGSDK